MGFSLDHLGNFTLHLIKSGSERHVHELGLGVHLEASLDGLVNSELEGEFFSGVKWVGLEGGEHLTLLIAGESLCRDDGNFLFLVQGSVKLDVSVRDSSDESKSLIFSEDLKELNSQWVESSNTLKRLVELLHLGTSDTSVLGE